jgi:hypothetical protein
MAPSIRINSPLATPTEGNVKGWMPLEPGVHKCAPQRRRLYLPKWIVFDLASENLPG